MYKIRIRFSKTHLMKFISHLDLMRMMERTLRRSKIPLAFTQGFNPHPKISFATALAIGVSSEGEYMDMEITEKIDLNDFKTTINKNLPQGIKLIQCKYIDLSTPALMAIVDFSTYVIKCILNEKYETVDIQDQIQEFLNLNEIIIIKNSKKRKKTIPKEVDIRPLIKSMEVNHRSNDELIFKTNLAAGSKGNLKPDLLMNKFVDTMNLAIDKDSIRIHRLDLFINNKGKLVTPIDIVV